MMKRLIVLVFCVCVCLVGCGHKTDTDTIYLEVETGDTVSVTLDISRQMSMQLDETTNFIYFTDSEGLTGAYLMFMTEIGVSDMFAQFGDKMEKQHIGSYDVDMFYAVIDGIPSSVSYFRVGNTGVAVVSGVSDNAVRIVLENIVVETV